MESLPGDPTVLQVCSRIIHLDNRWKLGDWEQLIDVNRLAVDVGRTEKCTVSESLNRVVSTVVEYAYISA